MDKDLLLYYMKKAGMTREDLAKALGITEKTLSNKILSKTEFSVSEMKKIAEACGISWEIVWRIFFGQSVELHSSHKEEL
jgi:transcriptional regulator with XRE-family HTH domain